MSKSNFYIVLFCGILQFSNAATKPKHAELYDRSTAAERAKVLSYHHQAIRLEKSDPDSAARFFRIGLLYAKQHHYRYGEAILAAGFSGINERYGNLKSALKYQEEALMVFNHLSLPEEICQSNIAMGRISGRMKNLAAGNQYLWKALNVYLLKKDVKGQIKALTALAEIYEFNKAYRQALIYDLRADSLWKTQSVGAGYFPLLIHLAEIQQKLGNSKKAMESYETGLVKSDDPAFGSWHVVLLRKAGVLWDSLGDHVTALQLHQESILKAKMFGQPEEEAKSQLSMAMSVRNDDAGRSIGHLKNALSIARNIQNSQLCAEILNSLSDLYQQESHYEEALTSLQQHLKLLDSLKNVNTGHKLMLLEGSFEIAQNKIRIQNLELINRQASHQRNISMVIIVTILTVLLVTAFYFYKTRKLNRDLNQAILTKDKLFSIIGHDLRNPVNGLVQLLKLMNDEDMSREEGQEMVALMQKQGDSTLKILNTLLKWGETQLKGVRVDQQIFDPYVYISRNIEVLKKDINDKKLIIKPTIHRHLKIIGDANHFDFIIRNLLSNAIKFSNPGGIIEIMAKRDSRNMVVFEVKDYGKGINEVQQHQFLSTNLDVTFGTGGEKGTGLGLLLIKEFVKANKGKIWLKSREGQGTAFFFSFSAAHT